MATAVAAAYPAASPTATSPAYASAGPARRPSRRRAERDGRREQQRQRRHTEQRRDQHQQRSGQRAARVGAGDQRVRQQAEVAGDRLRDDDEPRRDGSGEMTSDSGTHVVPSPVRTAPRPSCGHGSARGGGKQ
ncbi:hypothetical protein, partial [Micromonospora sp. AB353]|uniref:hypothetical protein n=1 Tax=Micromonospora sp. AB353 TaxID=3413282 RepID=UPI003C17C3DA